MYDFIFNNSEQILSKSTKNLFFIDNYRFKILGEGSFGIVYKVQYQNKVFIAKIMKKENDESKKIEDIKKKINLNKKSMINLFNEYIVNIKDVFTKKNPNIIIFEYLDINDIDKYLKSLDVLEDEHFYIIISKIILGLSLIHNKLKYSHGDIKPLNILYNPINFKLKIIDFGFACKLNDYTCNNKYKGTGNYIHPGMNNIMLNKKNNLFFVKTKKKIKKNLKKSPKINKNKQNIPKPISQDFFSLIITIFKIYQYLEIENNKDEQNLSMYITKYFSCNIKNNLYKYKKRLNKKKFFFKNLNKININEISNPVMKSLLYSIKNFWDYESYNFIKKEDKSKQILLKLLDISIKNIKNSKIKNKLQKDKNIIFKK